MARIVDVTRATPAEFVTRFHREFPERLTRLMAESGLPQWRIAQKAGAPSNQISGWKQGRVYPGAANVIRLARALGVSADYLLGLDKE